MRLPFWGADHAFRLGKSGRSIVVGWIAGSMVELLLSGGVTDQLPAITVLAAIVIVFALSFLVVPRGRG